MLTWIMFLKFLDDMEQIREQEATLAGKKFRPAIDPPYRWRDWAAKPDGITAHIGFTNTLFPSGSLVGQAGSALMSSATGRLWANANGGRLELQRTRRLSPDHYRWPPLH